MYLAANRNLHIVNGVPLDTRTLFRLHLVMQGIKRHQADAGICKRPRLPISPDILMVSLHQLWLPLMQWAASCICFFGFLRAGEICTGVQPQYPPLPPGYRAQLPHPTLCYSYLLEAIQNFPICSGKSRSVHRATIFVRWEPSCTT